MASVAPVPPRNDNTDENADQDPDEEFANDPWNAVCVLGLRVYSQKGEVSIETVRPEDRNKEEDTPLDVDDPAKAVSEEVPEGRVGAASGAHAWACRADGGVLEAVEQVLWKVERRVVDVVVDEEGDCRLDEVKAHEHLAALVELGNTYNDGVSETIVLALFSYLCQFGVGSDHDNSTRVAALHALDRNV